MYKAVVIGCGRKGSKIDEEKRWMTNYDRTPCSHASAYLALPQVELVAGADINPQALEDFGRRWGVTHLYTDYREMLAQEKPDIVSVTTHAILHAECTIAAAEAGAKGIICEKAMATSLEECDAMISACRKSGTKLLINHPRRYHPTYRKAKELLDSGAIGRLTTMFGAIYTALIHNGTHLFDMFRYFAGEPDWLVATRESPQGGDPGGLGMIHFSSGVYAFADIATMQGFELQLLGTEGRIVIHSYREGLEIWRYQYPEAPPEGREWFQFGPNKKAQVEVIPGDETTPPPMQWAVLDLIQAIEEDRDPLSRGEDGRAALMMGLAFHVSANQGCCRIPLPLEDRTLRVESR